MAALLTFTGTAAHAGAKIVLLYVATVDYVGSFVAKDAGFFDEQGLDVDLSIAQNGSVISAALVAGSAQIGTPTPPVLLQANEQGLDLVIVAGTHLFPLAPGGSGIVARTASEISGARDLVGKKVGVPAFSGTVDLLTKKWVQSNGVDYHEIHWVELPFPRMADALKVGLADAVASVNPFYSRIIDGKVGYAIGEFGSVVPAGTLPTAYASTRSWATTNAETVKAFRAALDEATAYIHDPAHLASVRESIAKYTELPPQAAATLAIPINIDAHAKPEGIIFWIEVSREQGLIRDNPEPASLIAP